MLRVLAWAALFACAYAHDFKTCGTDALGITAVTVTPDSPIPGQNLTVSFVATPTQDVVAGDKYTITVKVFGVALGHVDFDFCHDLGVVCPIKSGTAGVKYDATYLVPKAAPGGVPLTAEFTAHSSTGTQYSCIDVDVTMGKPPATAPVLMMVQPLDGTSSCLHHEDKSTNKCYQACGAGKFAVKGLHSKGECPKEYTQTDSTRKVKACSDGVTNLKYCTGDLHEVDLEESIMGMEGFCLHHVESNKCFEGCAEAKFNMTGLDDAGTCPSSFKVEESQQYIETCSDGATNIKYCFSPLYVVNVTMFTKGVGGIPNKAYWEAITMQTPWNCLHREDFGSSKCYEACAQDAKFAVQGLTTKGACSADYSATDSTKKVKACSDGITNLKYCTVNGLHVVHLVERTKGKKDGKQFWRNVAAENVAYWNNVATSPQPASDVTLYKISGSECGQATLDSKYASYAIKFAGLKEGTCADQGYTVADGTQSLKVPVLGSISIAKFKKSSVAPFNAQAECSKDSDCPSSYCNNGFCHGCFDKCCETDADCKKKGLTYCQNDATKMPPYFCHA
jgi:hypothetical protein